MSIRIHTLAKELKITSKELVDLCKKLGFAKGSALASLDEDEVNRVKTAIKSSKAGKKDPLAPVAPPKRPGSSNLSKSVPVLSPSKPKPTSPVSQSSGTSPTATKQPSKSTDAPSQAEKKTPVESPGKPSLPAKKSEEKKEAAETPATPLKVAEKSQTKEPPKSEKVAVKDVKVTQDVKITKDVKEKEIASKENKNVSPKIKTPEKIPQKPPVLPISKKPATGKSASEPQQKKKDEQSEKKDKSILSQISSGKISKPEQKTKSNSGHVTPPVPPKTKPADDKKKPVSPLPLDRKSGSAIKPSVPASTAATSEMTTATPTKPAQEKKKPSEPKVISHIDPTPHLASLRKKDFRGPMRSILEKFPLLGHKKKPDDSGDKKQETGKSGGPSIRLAPVPKSSSKTKKKTNEPAPQKPDMKLSLDVIRAAAAGKSRPLDEHIRKHEEKQRLKDKDSKDKPKAKRRDGRERERDKEKDKSKTRDLRTPEKTGVPLPEDVLAAKSRREREREKEQEKSRKKGDEHFSSDSNAVSSKKRRGGSRRRHAGMDFDSDERVTIPKHLKRRKKSQQSAVTAPRKSDIVIQLPCTVKQFAEQTGLSIAVVMKKLIEFEMPMIITSQLEEESAGLLGEAFHLKIDVRPPKSLEDEYVHSLWEQTDAPEDLKLRPPVVTFLGHVDHGKTSLLDRVLHLDVVSGEKGGITQHIRAYRITTPKGDVTFVDTPGHEAFTEMRARGANCTDIVVLVVAADDGVMPQTEEAISHARAAGVPIVVALNKCDLPNAKIDRAMQSLAANDVLPSEWGGDVEVVKTSALTGEGIETLLETLLMVAELSELKANPNRAALGVALESEMQSGQGVVAKILVQNGTLRTGDVVLCGTAHGRVKAMLGTLSPFKKLNAASPGTPVQLIGLDVAPAAGSKFCVLDDISIARQIAQNRAEAERTQELADMRPRVTLENLFQRISEANDVQTLNMIIRADVRGSIEAIRKELGKLEHPEVKIRILQATVGGITEADVQLADASDGIIVGFNVVPDEKARLLAEKLKIQVRRYDVIYNLANDVKAALEGMLKPISRDKELGRILVQRTFVVSRVGTIAGCRVLSGLVERDCRVRIIRENRIIGDYALESLKREKDDVKEVREGYECGIKLKGYNDLKEGDLFESYKTEEIARTF
ncbi:MAG: translation initiation factor IF-2 [Planctomycetaceae bacterium]|nr:translation initiation factor IF-2 [Planctomycetaceae bacterium]